MDTSLPITQLDPLGQGLFTGVGDMYSAYLGPLPTMQRSDPYAKRNTEVWDMPENYKGKNLYLRDTVEELMFTAHQKYLSTYIMPLVATDQINMQWEQLEYNAHLLEMTPYQTASRSMTSKRTVRRARLIRMGISALFENDFLRTAMGRAHFLATLNQMSRSVMESINGEIMRSLVMGHRYQQQFLRDTSMPTEQQLSYLLDEDKNRFAIVQKTKNPLEKLDMMISKEMQRYRGEADAYLIPKDISIYATIVPPEKTDYYLAGPLGPARVNNDALGTTLAAGDTMGSLDRVEPLHMVKNAPVFIVDNLQVENVPEEESQMLARVRQIGEYMTMIDECNDYETYKSDHRSILVYNQDIDDMTKITLEDAIENCGIWDENGELRPVDGGNSSSSDISQDFLLFNSEQGQPISYIAEIIPEFLTEKKILHATQKIITLFKGDEDLLAELLDDNEVEKPEFEDLNSEKQELLGYLEDFIKNYMGSDGWLSHGHNREGNIVLEKGQNLYFVILRRGAYLPAKKLDESRNDFSEEESIDNVNSAFFQTLMSQVPTSKKSEIQAIVDSPGDTLEKGEMIKERIIEYVSSNIPGMKFKDPAPAHKWYAERVKQYKELSKSKPKQVSSEKFKYVYLKAGLNLEGTGYEYVNTTQTQPLGRSSIRSVGEGMGLAGIGMFSDERQKNIQVQSKDKDDILDGIEKRIIRLEETTGANRTILFFALMYLQTRITKRNMLSFVRNNIMVPFNFLLFRPHMQYRTLGLVKCKRNGGTGFTGIGHSNLALSATSDTKVTRMSYTTHYRAIVQYPKNLYVQPDVYVQRTEGGAGCRFYSPDTYANLDLERLEASLICVAVPITETYFPSPMDISGRFYSAYNQNLGQRAQFERLHYSTAARYNGLYKWLQAKHGSDVPILGPGRAHVNRIVHQGHQQNYNPKCGEFNKITVCKGHWTKNVYAGCRNIREGALDTLETIDYSTRNAQ